MIFSNLKKQQEYPYPQFTSFTKFPTPNLSIQFSLLLPIQKIYSNPHSRKRPKTNGQKINIYLISHSFPPAHPLPSANCLQKAMCPGIYIVPSIHSTLNLSCCFLFLFQSEKQQRPCAFFFFPFYFCTKKTHLSFCKFFFNGKLRLFFWKRGSECTQKQIKIPRSVFCFGKGHVPIFDLGTRKWNNC